MKKTFKVKFKLPKYYFVYKRSPFTVFLEFAEMFLVLNRHRIIFNGNCMVFAKRLGEVEVFSNDEIRSIELKSCDSYRVGRYISVLVQTEEKTIKVGISSYKYKEVIDTLKEYCEKYHITFDRSNFDETIYTILEENILNYPIE